MLLTERLVVVDGLDLEARHAFTLMAGGAIHQAAGGDAGSVRLDCSQPESVDVGTLGMLVLIARQAQRRGVRITLVGASKRVRDSMDAARVSHLFDWRK